MPYAEETIEASRELYRLLRKIAPGDCPCVTYGYVSQQIGVHHRALRFPLEIIQAACRETSRPTLTVLVVDNESGRPNSGCDAKGEADFFKTRKEVATSEWPEHPWW